MRLLRISDSARQQSTNPIFQGVVYTQYLTEGLSKQLWVSVVSFQDGARNVFHAHRLDQLLVITEGEGVVATEAEERPVTAGDVVFIPAGEQHWHGARPGGSMTHLSILTAGKTSY